MNIKRYFNRGIFALTLLASTTACQQDEALQQPEADNGSRIIRAVIEQPTDTRTAVNHTSGAFSWVVNDEIQLLCGTKGADGSVTATPTTITSVDADGKGTFSLDGATDVIGAVYPAIFANDGKVDDNGVPTSVHLPHEYTYGSVNAPMYAVLDGESSTARFKHLAGVMAITVTDVPAHVNRFVFEANQRIAGAFDMKDMDSNPYIKLDEPTSSPVTGNVVTINFTETTETSQDMTFYIPLPVGEYQTFSVKLIGTDNKVYTKSANSTNAKNKIERCTLGLMPTAKTTHTYDFDNATQTYTIYTAEGLLSVNEILGGNAGLENGVNINANITLATDIDLTGLTLPGKDYNWTPIGCNNSEGSNFYDGTFEGNNHTITGLVIKGGGESDHSGLISDMTGSGKVQNLKLINASVSGSTYVGAIVGYTHYNSSVTISNCSVSGTITISEGEAVGGIAGYIADIGIIISGCSFEGTIEGTSSVAGGIVGHNSGKIIGCTVSGTIKANSHYLGGIVGRSKGDHPINKPIIAACLASLVHLSTPNSSNEIGGILGRFQASTGIIACFAYQCSQSTEKKALDEEANIKEVDPNSSSPNIEITQCYYETWVTNNGNGTFGGYDSDNTSTIATTWDTAVTAMNEVINAANWSVKYTWSGTQTEPKLTKVE